MAKLAVLGGKPVRAKTQKWPRWPIHDKTDVKLITKITESNRWSFDGPVEMAFAKAFADYHRSKFGLCCANGTVGLQIALEALDVGAFDEVIVPGITWQATAAACVDVNAIPILTDVEPDTWCLDLDKVEANINDKTKAVIVVHLYGSMADMDGLRKLCKKHNLYLIEDCAHQHGSFWKGKGVGAIGDVGSFSFQETKCLPSGEGGFNMCQTRTLFERIYSLRNCGRGYQDDMTNAIQSGNYRLTEWQAALLLGGLRRLDAQVKHKDANAIYLNAQLAQMKGLLPMRRRKQVTQQSYYNFGFRIDWDALGVSGVTNAHFCAALTAELGHIFERPYQPLNNCGLYKPHTKRRHQLSGAYWKAIDPKRFDLPVCTDAHTKSGVVTMHNLLLGSRKDMDDVVNAVAKVVENIESLKDIKNVQMTKWRALAD